MTLSKEMNKAPMTGPSKLRSMRTIDKEFRKIF